MLVANADAMAKEHSARRELRRREDRARRLSAEQPEESSPQTKPAQKKRKSKRKKSTSEQSGRKEVSSSDRLSAPFPPIRSSSSKPDLVLPLDTRDTAPERRLSATDRMAIELESLIGDSVRGWRKLHVSDRISILASLGTLLGVFMPWLSLPDRPHQIGLLSGGVVHAALALAAIALILKRDDPISVAPSKLMQNQRHRRVSVYHILISALSTIVGALFFLMWGLQKGTVEMEFHFGVYWTLACGTGLGYGGFVRFLRPRKNEDSI